MIITDEPVRCEICGADGTGGMVEYADGKIYHWREIPKDGRAYPLMCSGKLVRIKQPEEAQHDDA